MTVFIINQNSDSITLQITIAFNRSMLDCENLIQEAVNKAGRVAKREARIILTSTPRFAAQISHKMAEMPAPRVIADLEKNHNRKVSLSLIQRISEAVSAVVSIKEESWSYRVPTVQESEIKTVGIGLDGTCMLMCEGGYRQAMVGTIALYDANGERQHTTYIAAAPEYGKEKFKDRLTREIERTKSLYPSATRIGIADGAHDNWEFLEKHTDKHIRFLSRH